MGEARETGLNDLRRLWGVEAVPGCLVPGPGVSSGGRKQRGRGSLKEVMWGFALRRFKIWIAVLHLRDAR